jgi:cbb3-type cytochrome oxidase maturation protein
MSAVFLLIGVSVIVALGFLLAFLWAVRSGQFEDTFTPSVRMLFDHRRSVKRDSGSVDSNWEN